jgi:hypothetical protein
MRSWWFAEVGAVPVVAGSIVLATARRRDRSSRWVDRPKANVVGNHFLHSAIDDFGIRNRRVIGDASRVKRGLPGCAHVTRRT